jgi:ribosomal protein L15E
MGAYKYIGELYKKKQSDVLRFLLRVRYASVNCLASLFLRIISIDAGNTAN